MTVRMNAYFLEPKSLHLLCFSVIPIYLEISNLCELVYSKIDRNSMITNYKISAEDDIYN
jgi:hypothetical protein